MNEPESHLPLVLVTLLKGVMYRDDDAPAWQALVALQARAREYLAVLGLQLVLDEAEGHAYLRQRVAAEGESEPPRLVPRRPLGYAVSLLLVLLRRKLVELDAAGAETRLILSRDELMEMVRVFLPESNDEARLFERMDAQINRIAELGFLRRLRGQDDRFEVRRILKAYVDAQWLADFERRLTDYHRHAATLVPAEERADS